MMGTFFLRTKLDGSRVRLVALPGQYLDGVEIDINKFIKGSRSLREAYPVGTVFVTESLVDSVTHYGAGLLYAIVSDSELKDSSHRASATLATAWSDYQLMHPGVILSLEDEKKDEGKAMPLFAKELSLFDDMPEAPVFSSPAVKPAAKAPEKKTPVRAEEKISLLEQIRRDYEVPTIDGSGFYVSESNWQLLIRNIRRKVNTMLTGPTGTGKTELIRMIGEKLGLEVSVFDMGSMFDPTVQMLGSHRLEAGSSVFDYAPFAKAVQKPGIILLDELSRAPISTNNLLFPCLDSRRSLPVEQAGSKEETKIAVHPDCVFIATANIGTMYTGTQELDAALKNRFFNLELGYMPEGCEVKVLLTRCGIKAEDARNIVRVANTVRNLYGKGELSSSISTRETLCVAELVADGFTAIQAMELVILPQFEGTATEGERSVVRSCFMAA